MKERDVPPSASCDPGTRIDASRQDLQDAVHARDVFIATAAHELRNPLLPITLQLSALVAQAQRDGRGDGTLARGLERLQGLFEHYLKRTEMVLEVSRLTTGRFRTASVAVDLAELVRRILDAQRPLADFAQCELRARVEGPVLGLWDPTAFEQVVENLLSNAVRYGGGRPIEVVLEAEPCEVRLIVKDEGDGIRPEDQARIFEPFEQAMARRETGGFGIGLWVVRQLVSSMGGEIALDSAPGQGSTFTVTLPRMQAPSSTDEEGRHHGR
jgi:signal transduction histidine kinase